MLVHCRVFSRENTHFLEAKRPNTLGGGISQEKKRKQQQQQQQQQNGIVQINPLQEPFTLSKETTKNKHKS